MRPPPTDGRVVSFYSQEEGGLCIVGGPEGSAEVRVGECASPGARFVFDAQAKRIRSVQRPGQCLDGSVGGEPTLMHMRPCGPNMLEDWTYDTSNSRVRGTGGCVGVVGKLDIYAKLATQTCSNSTRQRWVMNDPVGARPQATPQQQAAAPPRAPAFRWIAQQNGAIDRHAMPAGKEADGQTLHVCTARYNNGVHIGKIRPGFQGCHIGYGGKALEITQYNVLAGSGRWAAASAGTIPNGAVKGGSESDNRPLYICRASFNGGVLPGKIGRNFGGCNFAYGDREQKSPIYEVLVD